MNIHFGYWTYSRVSVRPLSLMNPAWIQLQYWRNAGITFLLNTAYTRKPQMHHDIQIVPESEEARNDRPRIILAAPGRWITDNELSKSCFADMRSRRTCLHSLWWARLQREGWLFELNGAEGVDHEGLGNVGVVEGGWMGGSMQAGRLIAGTNRLRNVDR